MAFRENQKLKTILKWVQFPASKSRKLEPSWADISCFTPKTKSGTPGLSCGDLSLVLSRK